MVSTLYTPGRQQQQRPDYNPGMYAANPFLGRHHRSAAHAASYDALTAQQMTPYSIVSSGSDSNNSSGANFTKSSSPGYAKIIPRKKSSQQKSLDLLAGDLWAVRPEEMGEGGGSGGAGGVAEQAIMPNFLFQPPPPPPPANSCGGGGQNQNFSSSARSHGDYHRKLSASNGARTLDFGNSGGGPHKVVNAYSETPIRVPQQPRFNFKTIAASSSFSKPNHRTSYTGSVVGIAADAGDSNDSLLLQDRIYERIPFKASGSCGGGGSSGGQRMSLHSDVHEDDIVKDGVGDDYEDISSNGRTDNDDDADDDHDADDDDSVDDSYKIDENSELKLEGKLQKKIFQ